MSWQTLWSIFPISHWSMQAPFGVLTDLYVSSYCHNLLFGQRFGPWDKHRIVKEESGSPFKKSTTKTDIGVTFGKNRTLNSYFQPNVYPFCVVSNANQTFLYLWCIGLLCMVKYIAYPVPYNQWFIAWASLHYPSIDGPLKTTQKKYIQINTNHNRCTKYKQLDNTIVIKLNGKHKITLDSMTGTIFQFVFKMRYVLFEFWMFRLNISNLNSL